MSESTCSAEGVSRPVFRAPIAPRIAAALAIAAAACDRPPPAPEAPRVTVWDSAGIEIVENHASEWGDSARWSVDPDPEFVIGGSAVIESADDPSHLVWQVRGVARLSNGNVLVHSGGEEAVMLFEPSGALVTMVGRKGQGPGEFVRPQHIQVLPGDTIAVWDYGFTRVSYFDATGTLVGERRLDVATVLANTRTDTEYSPESIDIPLLDGSFVVQRGIRDYPQPQPGEIRRRPVEYLRIDTAYGLHSFGWWKFSEHIGMTSKWRSYPWPPYARRSIVVAGGNPPTVYITDGDVFEIRQFAADGALKRILRRDADPMPITSEELAEYRARAAEVNPDVDWADWEQSLAAAPPREFHPAILWMLLDTEGHLWVWERVAERPHVFDPEGRWLGTVDIPAAVWIDKDMVLALRSDPDTDVQRIEGYRLRKD